MGVEGVLHGSNGPGFYPAKEWANAVPSWNMKPITNDHPKDKDGNPCSAASKEVIEKTQLGFLLNTGYENKLRTEAWFDKVNTKTRCLEVYNALQAGKMIEVSTGLFVDQEKTPGEFKGRKYDWISRNHRPDHLAVLPGKVGACSIADGAGMLANDAVTVENLLIANENLGRLTPIPKETDVNDKKPLVDTLIANGGGLWAEDQREWLTGRDKTWLEKAVAALPKPTTNNNPTPAPVPQTVAEWLAASKAPPEVVFAVNSAIEATNHRVAQLVANIMALPANKFTKEYLSSLPEATLVGIESIGKAAMPAAPVANGHQILQPQFGPAWVPGSPTPVHNQGAPVQVPVLAPAAMTFTAPAGKK
jgi:hypothetical protein